METIKNAPETLVFGTLRPLVASKPPKMYHTTTIQLVLHLVGHSRVHSTNFPLLETVKVAPKRNPSAPKNSRFTTLSPET